MFLNYGSYVFKLWHISVDSAAVSLLCCSNYLFCNYAVVLEWHTFWATSCSMNPVAQTLYYDHALINLVPAGLYHQI